MKKIKFLSFSEKTEGFAEAPIPASRHVPQWYKNQPGSIDDAAAFKVGGTTSTIKRCMPFLDILMAGYILHVPCDIYIDATSNPENIEWSIPEGVKYMKKTNDGLL